MNKSDIALDRPKAGMYIHIPFCDHKCIYCDFYSIITSDNTHNFLTALKKEIAVFSERFPDKEYDSIFFGGGTPSLMNEEFIREILNTVSKHYNITSNAEITLETNPGTVNKEKIARFIKAGVNRMSVGVQSFDAEELKFLTRIHDAQTAIDTIRNAAEAGLTNISLDLIFNLPNQTPERWLTSLNTAFSLPITHLSAYSLILERGTILNKMVIDGKVKMQGEEFDAELYSITIDKVLSKGFKQYEVSNFALPGFECRHNLHYWHREEYLSFGTSSHSFMDETRWWNYSPLKFYIDAVTSKGDAIIGSEKVTREEALEEYVMLFLRSDGLDVKKIEKEFPDFQFNKMIEYLRDCTSEGLAEFGNGKIVLTPKGYAVADSIIEDALLLVNNNMD